MCLQTSYPLHHSPTTTMVPSLLPASEQPLFRELAETTAWSWQWEAADGPGSDDPFHEDWSSGWSDADARGG